MGSSSKTSITSRFLIVGKIDVSSLREYAKMLSPTDVESFDQAYGNIRRLLQLDVQENAISAMSQFYDSAIRCFLFKNFQLSPTLEEYERLLGFARSDNRPYQFQGEYYSDQKLAPLLRISVEELKRQKTVKHGVEGFSQDFFEGLLKNYADAKQWGLFKLALALTIFGIVLFPQLERFIDETAIGAFLAFKDAKNPINPVPALLAETYRAFTRYSEFHKKKMSFSTHVFYAWFLTHIVNNKKKVKELISYALSSEVEVMSPSEWFQNLGKINDHQVRWFAHSCWDERPSVLFQCGDFQNVPLMGVRGCINYNPSLTLRQLGYPMRNSPTEAMLSRFYLFERTPNCGIELRRISQAWQAKVYKGNEVLSKRTSSTTFCQWLQERLKTRCRGASSSEEKIPEPYIPSCEEMNELKVALAQAEEDKKALCAELERLTSEKEELKRENALKTTVVAESINRFKKEEHEKLEAQKYLKGAREELKRCEHKRKEALRDAGQWKNLCKTAKENESSANTLLDESIQETLKWANQCQDLEKEKIAIVDLLKDYQQRLSFEQNKADELKNHLRCLEEAYHQVRVESKHWEERYVSLLARVKEHEVIKEMNEEIQHWKDKFSRLAELAQRAIVGVPKALKKAEAEVHFLDTPPEVIEFVELCRSLVTEFRGQTQDAGIGKKRQRSGDLEIACI